MRLLTTIHDEIETAYHQGDAETLIQLATELSASDEPEAEALECRARGGAERIEGRYTLAIEYYQQALEIHHKLGQLTQEAADASSLGAVFHIVGSFPLALEHMHRGLVIRESLEEQAGIADVLYSIGLVHNDTGDYPTALEFYHRAQSVYEDLGDLAGLARVLASIATSHGNSGNMTDALELYNKSLRMHEALGNREGYAQVIGNLGTLHVDADDYPSALKEYKRALSIYEELGNPGGAAGAMINMAFVLVDTDQLGEARELYERLEGLGIPDPRFKIILILLHGKLLEHEGRLEDAHNALMSGLTKASEYGLRNETSELHSAVRDLSISRNDFKTYLEHNTSFLQITDEIKGKQAALKMVTQQKQREMEAIERERERERAVLYSTLPKHVADRMVRGERVTDQFESASVMFMDIAGFTRLSDHLHAEQVVQLLEAIFNVCDTVCNAHGLTKVKTIGDSYLAVSGVPEALDDHVHRMALAAVDMLAGLQDLEVFLDPELGDISWVKDVGDITVRFGVHCGPLVAGVVGKERLQYDIWGDTVNTASRMESTGTPGRIQASSVFAKAALAWLEKHPTTAYRLVERGEVEVKGKGTMTTYWIESGS